MFLHRFQLCLWWRTRRVGYVNLKFNEMEFEKCTIISGFRRSGPISWRMSNKLLVENLLASTFSSHSFSAHYTVLSAENNMKCILQSIQPLQKCGMHDHQSVHPSYWYKSWYVTLMCCILCFISIQALWMFILHSKQRIMQETPCLYCTYVTLALKP